MAGWKIMSAGKRTAITQKKQGGREGRREGGKKAEWEKEGWEETVRGGVVVITQFIFREPFVFPGRFGWKSAHGLQAETSHGSLGLTVLTTSYHFPSVSLLKVLHYKKKPGWWLTADLPDFSPMKKLACSEWSRITEWPNWLQGSVTEWQIKY